MSQLGLNSAQSFIWPFVNLCINYRPLQKEDSSNEEWKLDQSVRVSMYMPIDTTSISKIIIARPLWPSGSYPVFIGPGMSFLLWHKS